MLKYNQLLDPREFESRFVGDYGYFDIERWRSYLKSRLLETRGHSSDLTGYWASSIGAFHMHEGIIPRAALPRSVKWHYMIFHEINCFLLTEVEHIPQPPSRIVCYWLAVLRYHKETVDSWINSLPWKVPPDRPWAGTIGAKVLLDEVWPSAYAPLRTRISNGFWTYEEG